MTWERWKPSSRILATMSQSTVGCSFKEKAEKIVTTANANNVFLIVFM
jgi:hypothetical protein